MVQPFATLALAQVNREGHRLDPNTTITPEPAVPIRIFLRPGSLFEARAAEDGL
jgi:hypothetical protein